MSLSVKNAMRRLRGARNKPRREARGTFGRNIIKTERKGDRLIETHATKGVRVYRAVV